MRRWFGLNGLLIGAAAIAALVLTITRPSPEGLIDLGVGDREVRAAPSSAASETTRHNLAALRVVSSTLLKVQDSYVDPARIDPKEMLYAALDSVQYEIPEVMIETNRAQNDILVVVGNKQARFSSVDVDSPWKLNGTLKRIFRFIEANMNPGADLSEVEYAAVNGMLSTLDPHSVLLDPEMARDMEASTSGAFGGLGIHIGMRDDKLTVLKPMKGTPAAAAGIQKRDHIVKINDELTENLTLNEAVERMRGDPGTQVTLWIARQGAEALIRTPITRARIETESVEWRLLSRKVGYVKITSFSDNTESGVKKALAQLKKRGAKRYVLDLRWNPGGLLEQAIRVSDQFLDKGTIVTTVGGSERDPRRAERDASDVVDAPLAVLVNSGSASASEIVAGALKNLDRAVIVGTTTFGKGSVQMLYKNLDKSKLKLTIAQYLTPGDRSIQSLGITPDVELSRMRIPDKNLKPADWVKLLPSKRSYREKDLKSHLDSNYAIGGAKPTLHLSYVYEDRKKSDDDELTDEEASTVVDPAEEEPLDDEFVLDYEIELARDLVAEAGKSTRTATLKAAKRVIDARHVQEQKKLTDKLAALAIDWSAPASKPSRSTLEARFRIDGDPDTIRAGQKIRLIGEVTNRGTTPAYQVMARINADDSLFDDRELLFGKIEPGETRTWPLHLEVSKRALDRMDYLMPELRDATGIVNKALRPIKVRVVAAERPTFAYSHQLIDQSNRDGLIQPGEKHALRVTVKNTGKAAAQKTVAVLRNASGDDLKLRKARFPIGELAPGASRTVEFAFESAAKLSNKEVVVEMSVYDAELGESVQEKLHYPVRKSSAGPSPAKGVMRVSNASTLVHEGAAADSTVIATAKRGSVLATTGRLGDWVRVDLGGGRRGFVHSGALSRTSGSAKLAGVSPRWQVTPPTLQVHIPTFEVDSPTFEVRAQVSDDSKVEDAYVLVSNRDAKVDNRKVFYRSNRGSKSPDQLSFTTDIPLWPGSNMVTVVARENGQVQSSETIYLYRPKDGKTAAAAAK